MNLPKINPPKINVIIQQVVANTRTLRADWTFEAPQDLEYTTNADLEDQLAKMLANEFNKRK